VPLHNSTMASRILENSLQSAQLKGETGIWQTKWGAF